MLPVHSSEVTQFCRNIFRITTFLKSILGSFPLENVVLGVVFKIQSFCHTFFRRLFSQYLLKFSECISGLRFFLERWKILEYEYILTTGMDNDEYLLNAVVAFMSCTETALFYVIFGLFRFSVTFHYFRYLTQVRISFLSTRIRQFLHSSKTNSKEFVILLNILFISFNVYLFHNSKLRFLNFVIRCLSDYTNMQCFWEEWAKIHGRKLSEGTVFSFCLVLLTHSLPAI